MHSIFHMPLYQRASIIVAVGGLLFGLDTGTIGPVTAMSAFRAYFGELSSVLHGVVVSTILIGGTLSGIFAGNIADIYGRIWAITVGSVIFGVGATLETCAVKLSMFIVGRFIKGLGEGLFLGILCVYVCEIAPARRRGPLASVIQILVCIGIAAGYFISFATSRIQNSSAAWRVPLAVQAGSAFAFAVACCRLPPSPRWLIAKHRMDEARVAFDRLGLESSEIEQMVTQDAETTEITEESSLGASIRSHFKDLGRVFQKRVRKQAAFACFLMAMQQFSGIDGILFYAPLLFQQAGLASEKASFLASGVSALLMLAVTIPASIYVDKVGRRLSIIGGGSILVGIMLLIGSLYASNSVHGDHGVARWVVIVCIYLFSIVFCMTWAISVRIYASEIQPAVTRASATGLAQSANWLSNFVVALTTPILLAKSSFGAYYLFGCATLFTVFICFFFMPETKGQSLEALEQVFVEHKSAIRLGGLRRRRAQGQTKGHESPQIVMMQGSSI